MKKYLDIKPNPNANKIKIELYYHLGGYNLFTYKEEPRGYYLSVTPVWRGNNCETITAFSGIKQCIKQVARKSEKAYQTALKDVDMFLPDLINYVCNKNNIEIIEEAYENE